MLRLLPYDLSIRNKIVYSISALLAFVVVSAMITYGIVWNVEKKVEQSGLIEDLFNLTLELRRFEKNYFLYEQEKDYIENLSYAEKLQIIFKENKLTLYSVSSRIEVKNATDSLDRYVEDMKHLNPMKISAVEWYSQLNRIRAHGKELTDFAEKAVFNQKKAIHAMLRATRQILLVSICAIFFLSLSSATFLARRVTQSLKKLEIYMGKIVQGEIIDIPIKKAEPEIRAIFNAFNRMTHELKIRQHQLVQSEKLAAFGTLLAGIAHELNNPLSNISTSAQILTEEMETDDLAFKKNLVVQIDEQADKARDIVKTLLEFSRSKEFEMKELPLKKLILETIRLIRGEVPTQVEILVDVPDDLTIFADKQRIQQVFLNLMKNAVDALNERGHIWIMAQASNNGEGGRNVVEIMVEDDGPGIDPENFNHIFDPFFTTKDVGKGSGLGLFIVHDIIEAHGGLIQVNSNIDQGTTFTIWLINGKGAQK
jgi:signal transduction histidine kinase